MVLARLKFALEHDYRVVVSALTVIEAQHPKQFASRLDFVLSKITILDVTEQIAREATRLLREAGLHGHKYAIDAVVAATALRQPGPVSMITSDLDDMTRLCGKRILLVPV